MSILLILVLFPSLACVANFPVRGKSFSPAGLRLHTALYFLVLLFLIRSLNPRIESRENRRQRQTKDLTGLVRFARLFAPTLSYFALELTSLVLKNTEAVNNLAGRAERWDESTNRRRGGWWGERDQNVHSAPSRYDSSPKQSSSLFAWHCMWCSCDVHVVYISGAKFREHCFYISGDILDSVFYCSSGTIYDVITIFICIIAGEP